MSKGYVYILSNPAMPGLLKIGRSIHGGKQRANQLFQTGTPAPFALEFEIFVDEPSIVEAEVHKAMECCREFKGREFFRVGLCDAVIEVMKHAAACFDHRVEQVDMCNAVDALTALSKKVGVPPIIGCSAASFISEFSMRDAVAKYEAWAESRRQQYEAERNRRHGKD